MKTLPNNWITQGTLDFEYKKYILLAYLQHCKSNFTESKLYPPLSELVEHYRNILTLRNNVENMRKQFPRDLTAIDPSKQDLIYHPSVADDDSVTAIYDILNFAIPSMHLTLETGKEVFEFVENHLTLEPIGVLPVYSSEGYLLLNEDKMADVFIYQYKMDHVTLSDENYRSLSMNYIYRTKKSFSNNFETIKMRLVSQFSALPNPATFLCFSKIHIPLKETLLPVTKRLLLKNINSNSF